MKLSIIIPVYNAEQYLNNTISNIIQQTFTDFELLLIDDGSPDGCPPDKNTMSHECRTP